MSKIRFTVLAGAAMLGLLLVAGSPALAAQCISEKRLKELRSSKWSQYHFHYMGVRHSGKTKYSKDGRVVAVSKGITYDRGTWKIKNGFVVRYAPDRPGRKRYKLKILKKCS